MELISQRLLLRRMRMEDAPAIVAYRSLPEVARFQSWQSFGPDDGRKLVTEQVSITPDTPGTWFQLAIVLADTQAVIGDCGIHFLEDGRQVELGITVSPVHQGHGVASEALCSVLEYVFGSLHKHRALAVTDVENHAASRLFRHLGFRQEAHNIENIWFKGAWGSEYVFALLRREWQARSSGRGLCH